MNKKISNINKDITKAKKIVMEANKMVSEIKNKPTKTSLDHTLMANMKDRISDWKNAMDLLQESATPCEEWDIKIFNEASQNVETVLNLYTQKNKES